MNLNTLTPYYKVIADAQSRALDGTCYVVRGLAPTANGAGLRVDVAAGDSVEAGTPHLAYAGGNVTCTAASSALSLLYRRDIVYRSSAGTLTVTAGTAALLTSTTPVPPALPASATLIAVVFIAPGQTTLVATDVEDVRQTRVSDLPAISATVFGATGNGVTDDTAFLQAALDAVPSTGGRVTIPPGTYRLTAELTVNKSNLTIEGAGDSTVLKLGNSSSFYIFNVATTANVTNLKIRNLGFDGNSANQGVGSNGGIKAVGPTYDLTEFEISGCYFYDFLNYGNGINIQKASKGVISHNRFNLISGISVGGQVTDISIVGNTCLSSRDSAIGVIGGSGTVPLRVSIVGNVIDTTSAGQGIEVLRGQLITISGNTIKSANARGIYVWDGGLGAGKESTDITITGNTILNSGQEGIGLNRVLRANVSGNTSSYSGSAANVGAGIYMQNSCARAVLSGNICMNNGVAAALVPFGIYIASSTDVLVVGNTCGDDGPATQTKGIDVFGAASSGIALIGNHLSGNTGAGYTFEAGIGGGNVNFATLNYVTGVIQYDDRAINIPVYDGTDQHMKSLLAVSKLGFGTGAGGAITQQTNSATAVTIDKPTGQITTVALTTAVGAEERFVVNNSTVAATDTISIGTTYNGAGTPAVTVLHVATGAFDIVITNLHAANALNAVLVVNFAVIKAVAA